MLMTLAGHVCVDIPAFKGGALDLPQEKGYSGEKNMFYSSLSGMGLASTKGQAAYDVDEARADASEAKSEAEVLKHDIDRLMMITEALWTFMKKEHGYTDDTLATAISAIDLRHSGANKEAQEKCPSCGRMVSAHRRLCIYCGNVIPAKFSGLSLRAERDIIQQDTVFILLRECCTRKSSVSGN